MATERALTAADRLPEVGDVIGREYEEYVRIAEPLPPFIVGRHYEPVVSTGWPAPRYVLGGEYEAEMRYFSRKDNGPITTTDEPGRGGEGGDGGG